MICTQFHTNMKVIRTNNAQEYFLKYFFTARGIIHQHSYFTTPQQNSVAERKHLQILYFLLFLHLLILSLFHLHLFLPLSLFHLSPLMALILLLQLRLFLQLIPFLQLLLFHLQFQLLLFQILLQMMQHLHLFPLLILQNLTLYLLVRRSHKITKPPSYLQSYKCSSIACDQFAHSNPANRFGLSFAKSGTQYPLSNYLDSSKLSPSYAHFCFLITDVIEPKFYHEFVKDLKQQKVMDAEITTLEYHTWTLTPLPSNKKAIGCKWVYKVKYKLERDIKLGWVLRTLLNKKVLISQRPFPLWQNGYYQDTTYYFCCERLALDLA